MRREEIRVGTIEHDDLDVTVGLELIDQILQADARNSPSRHYIP